MLRSLIVESERVVLWCDGESFLALPRCLKLEDVTRNTVPGAGSHVCFGHGA